MQQKDFRLGGDTRTAQEILAAAAQKQKKEDLRYVDVKVGDKELVVKRWKATESLARLPSFMAMWFSTVASSQAQMQTEMIGYSEGINFTGISAAQLTQIFIEHFQDVDFVGWIKDFCGDVYVREDLKTPIDLDEVFDDAPFDIINLVQEVAQVNFMMQLSQTTYSMPQNLMLQQQSKEQKVEE